MGRSGLLKLGDFGISKNMGTKLHMETVIEVHMCSLCSESGSSLPLYFFLMYSTIFCVLDVQIVGTPYYMSPELMKGEA